MYRSLEDRIDVLGGGVGGEGWEVRVVMNVVVVVVMQIIKEIEALQWVMKPRMSKIDRIKVGDTSN